MNTLFSNLTTEIEEKIYLAQTQWKIETRKQCIEMMLRGDHPLMDIQDDLMDIMIGADRKASGGHSVMNLLEQAQREAAKDLVQEFRNLRRWNSDSPEVQWVVDRLELLNHRDSRRL